MADATITLKGFDNLTELDLSEELPEGALTKQSAVSESQAGELATTLIILVGVPAVKGLVDWMLKDRTEEEEVKTIEFKDTSGAIHKETIRTLKKTSKSREGLIRHIASLCGIEVPTNL